MEIKTSKAIALFFPNPKMELVYYEAIANAIDASASEVTIESRIDPGAGAAAFEIIVRDNGIGFTNKNFQKFTKLLDVDQPDHKGVGRLVYLNYFNKVNITSIFGNQQRSFVFNHAFCGDFSLETLDTPLPETKLHFKHFNQKKIHAYQALKPKTLKNNVIRHFFPYFLEKKRKGAYLNLHFLLRTFDNGTFVSQEEESFNIQDLEDLETKSFYAVAEGEPRLFEIMYTVKKTPGPTTIVTSICTDGRTLPLNLLQRKQMPAGYEVVFIVFSDFFTGKSDSSRQHLKLEEKTMAALRTMLTEHLSQVLHAAIPEISRRNRRVLEEYSQRYPHLQGYFCRHSAGLIERQQVLAHAQQQFFDDQRSVLEAETLDQATYEKSLELSSRVLMEYILYRNLIIRKLADIDTHHAEAEIHQTIVPMKRRFPGETLSEQVFFNNAWLLDDKFMNFRTILSDCDLKQLARELALDDEVFRDGARPDLTIIFSNDPHAAHKVDAVIVELKKTGLPLRRRDAVVSQLRQRARRLARLYPEKIQRIWFYGIVDFNPEFRISLLEDNFIELYSAGNLFYKEVAIIPDNHRESERIPFGMFLLDYQAFINDAAARNKTFLEILKAGCHDQAAPEPCDEPCA